MKIGPKYKLCRKLGSGVFEKCQTQKFQLNQEKKAKTARLGRSSRSNFANQLIEKQKARFTYGISEKQFNSYVTKALDHSGNPAENLYGILEHRLDNVVYRLGLVSTRRHARQVVSHGHVTVNGRKVTIPSYHVKKDDVIALRDKSMNSPLFEKVLTEGVGISAPWLSFDSGKKSGSVTGNAQLEPTEMPFDLTKVIEFYSR
jgi:small subunit ribosomal protein S4